MANKVIKPSVNRLSGLDGRPGDNLQFWHKGRETVCQGIIRAVTGTHYEILGFEEPKPGQPPEGYTTSQIKRNCIVLGR